MPFYLFMNLKMLWWNVRGFNDKYKRLHVGNMLVDQKADLVCSLWETENVSIKKVLFTIFEVAKMWIGVTWN